MRECMQVMQQPGSPTHPPAPLCAGTQARTVPNQVDALHAQQALRGRDEHVAGAAEGRGEQSGSPSASGQWACCYRAADSHGRRRPKRHPDGQRGGQGFLQLVQALRVE